MEFCQGRAAQLQPLVRRPAASPATEEPCDIKAHRSVTSISSVEPQDIVLMPALPSQRLTLGRLLWIERIKHPALGCDAPPLGTRLHLPRTIAGDRVRHGGDGCGSGRRAEARGAAESTRSERENAESACHGSRLA